MKQPSQPKERIFAYDLLRTIACLMVIIMHSPMPSSHASGLFLSSISYLMAPCIGLFFMISGGLLLPIKSTSTFLKKRFTKIIFPTLFWSGFYLIVNYVGKDIAPQTLVKQLLSIPFTPQGNGVLWFLYTLMGLYLATPIISRWIEAASEKEIQFYLFLWIISLCYPLLDSFLFLSTGNTGILYYFSGYLGYYILGYYLRKYPGSIRKNTILPICILSLLAPVCCKLFQWKVDFYSVFWYLSIFVMTLCIGWFKVITKLSVRVTSEKTRNVIILYSNLSLGIYLVHIFVMRTILWHIQSIIDIDSYILQTLIIILLTTMISFVVCLCISYLPKSEYLIGYHRK